MVVRDARPGSVPHIETVSVSRSRSNPSLKPAVNAKPQETEMRPRGTLINIDI
jgi:hypothetical protein